MKKYTQLVIIRYPASGETIAYRRDDPQLIDTLIELCNIEYDDFVVCAEFEEDVVIEPIQNENRLIVETHPNSSYNTKIHTGKDLKFHRRKWNLSQSELADQIGKTPTTIHRWEHGKMQISKKSRVSLNEFFNKLYNTTPGE
jgi:DNA-binding transcriptional regulator YiaG